MALLILSLSVLQAAAQQDVPAAPVPAAPVPSAPAPSTAPVFPKTSPDNFTAASPTQEVVSAFVQANIGYDENNVWQVYAIRKTPVEGVSDVTVLLGDKSGKQKMAMIHFFALADGKHIITSDKMVPFGAHPFADSRALLQQRANGPYRGSASKDLEIVEFADFQCPHCKDAQANMDKLAVDFPNARIVFQSLALPQHPAAAKAAADGVCVASQGGSTAFFAFATAVFDGQDGLGTPDGATLTLNSAVTKAGLDPAKVNACAAEPATLAAIEASKKLAEDLDINQTPTLVINGHPIGANAPYDILKKIIQYQAKADGVTAQ
jgi:protein-disulfide isomerase